MPTLRQMVKKMMDIEDQDASKEPGQYPVFFKNEFYELGFMWLLKWEKFKRKVKSIWKSN